MKSLVPRGEQGFFVFIFGFGVFLDVEDLLFM